MVSVSRHSYNLTPGIVATPYTTPCKFTREYENPSVPDILSPSLVYSLASPRSLKCCTLINNGQDGSLLHLDPPQISTYRDSFRIAVNRIRKKKHELTARLSDLRIGTEMA
jgi:hypothetical protein